MERIQIIGSRSYVTAILISSSTTAEEVCQVLTEQDQSGELGELAQSFRVVLVLSYFARRGSGAAEHLREGRSSSDARSEEASGHGPQPYHFVRTLHGSTRLREAQQEAAAKLQSREGLREGDAWVRWFWKEEQTTPLPLDLGHASGIDSSDDERGFAWRDLSHLTTSSSDRDGICSGFLLKRSSRDPNVWRRRWCVLTEDKLWYLRSRSGRRRRRSPYVPLVNMRDKVREPEAKQRIPFGIELHTTSDTYFFRAYNRDDQSRWMQWLSKVTDVNTTNDYIALAEYMINDEASARQKRFEQLFDDVFPGKAYAWFRPVASCPLRASSDEAASVSGMIAGPTSGAATDRQGNPDAAAVEELAQNVPPSPGESWTPPRQRRPGPRGILSTPRRRRRRRRRDSALGPGSLAHDCSYAEALMIVQAVHIYRELTRRQHLHTHPRCIWYFSIWLFARLVQNAIDAAVERDTLEVSGSLSGRAEEVVGNGGYRKVLRSASESDGGADFQSIADAQEAGEKRRMACWIDFLPADDLQSIEDTFAGVFEQSPRGVAGWLVYHPFPAYAPAARRTPSQLQKQSKQQAHFLALRRTLSDPVLPASPENGRDRRDSLGVADAEASPAPRPQSALSALFTGSATSAGAENNTGGKPEMKDGEADFVAESDPMGPQREDAAGHARLTVLEVHDRLWRCQASVTTDIGNTKTSRLDPPREHLFDPILAAARKWLEQSCGRIKRKTPVFVQPR